MTEAAPHDRPCRAHPAGCGPPAERPPSQPSTIYDRLRAQITIRPGQTERELAHGLFGKTGCQPRISFSCQLLLGRGLVVRTGAGGRGQPFRYYPASAV